MGTQYGSRKAKTGNNRRRTICHDGHERKITGKAPAFGYVLWLSVSAVPLSMFISFSTDYFSVIPYYSCRVDGGKPSSNSGSSVVDCGIIDVTVDPEIEHNAALSGLLEFEAMI